MINKYGVDIKDGHLITKSGLNIELSDDLKDIYNNKDIDIENKLKIILSKLYLSGYTDLKYVIMESKLFDLIFYCPKCNCVYLNFGDYYNRLILYKSTIDNFAEENTIIDEDEEGDEEFAYSMCVGCSAEFENLSSIDFLIAIDSTNDECIKIGEVEGNKYNILAGYYMLKYLYKKFNGDSELVDELMYNNRHIIEKINDDLKYDLFKRIIKYIEENDYEKLNILMNNSFLNNIINDIKNIN